MPRALDDPVADATLSGYIRVLRHAKPTAFLLENVAGIRYDIHAEAFDYIEGAARELGYETSWAVINAANYGVPQIRERFFMIGSRVGGPVAFPEPTHAKEPGSTLLNGTLPRWRTAGGGTAGT